MKTLILKMVGLRFAAFCCAWPVATCTTSATAGLLESYEHRPGRDFLLPAVLANLQGGVQMDNLPDGRLVMVTTRESAPFTTAGVELRVETAVGSRDFRYLGDLPLPAVDAAWPNPGGFLAISQNNSGVVRVAFGNSNYSVGILDAAALTIPAVAPAVGTPAPVAVKWFDSLGFNLSASGNFLATGAWRNNTELAIASGDFVNSQLNLLDVTSPVGNPTVPLRINGPAGASGGIAFDEDGDLYYGVGFGVGVGNIRKFDKASWPTTTQNFTAGELQASALSAAWLQFDTDENLLVGGGNFFGSGQINFFAIFGGPSYSGAPRTFDPDTGSSSNTYSLVYNDATGEILAWDNFGSNPRQVFVIAPETVPEPATVIMFALGAVVLGAGAWIRNKKTN
jgi:hypothetical protein